MLNTIIFFCLWRKHQSALAAGKTKKINNIRVEKVPTWLWCQCDFPKVIKHPSLSICYFLFWSYLIYAFYFFSLAVVAIFRFCHRRTYCCWRNGFFYRKIKSLPLIFFLFFRFFNFSSQKVRYSCVYSPGSSIYLFITSYRLEYQSRLYEWQISITE